MKIYSPRIDGITHQIPVTPVGWYIRIASDEIFKNKNKYSENKLYNGQNENKEFSKCWSTTCFMFWNI